MQAVRNWKFLRSKTFVAVAILWFLGLSAMFLAPAPVKVTEEMWKRYEAKLDEAIAYTRQNANSTTVRLLCIRVRSHPFLLLSIYCFLTALMRFLFWCSSGWMQ